jgi:signal transduction histidine kinase
MSERVKLLGGTLETGPGSARGWVVSAVLPKDGLPQ